MATRRGTDVRRLVLDAAAAATALLADPRVAVRWCHPSGCDGWSVGAVAAHLARALVDIEHRLSRASGRDGPSRSAEGVTAGAYCAALPRGGAAGSAGPDADRERSTATAAALGPSGVQAEARASLSALCARLPGEPAGRVLAPMGLTMSLDEYLRACLVEICVRAEDLALSLDGDVPPLPDDAVRGAVDVLVDSAVHRQVLILRPHAAWDRADVLSPL
ncbi:MAG: maleylpyruvate isomerase N-terminal domain-containing protein [Kineosporiaceae bacterium]